MKVLVMKFYFNVQWYLVSEYVMNYLLCVLACMFNWNVTKFQPLTQYNLSYITMHVHISCESKIPIFMIIVRLSNCVHSVREMKTWIYWSESKSSIYFYKVLRKDWTIYWSEQSFAGLGPEGRCSSWGLALRQAIMQFNIHFS
jgi:hypothetical protein